MKEYCKPHHTLLMIEGLPGDGTGTSILPQREGKVSKTRLFGYRWRHSLLVIRGKSYTDKPLYSWKQTRQSGFRIHLSYPTIEAGSFCIRCLSWLEMSALFKDNLISKQVYCIHTHTQTQPHVRAHTHT